MFDLRALLADDDGQSSVGGGCTCAVSVADRTLELDATDCPGGGRLADRPDCLETVVVALRERDADVVRVSVDGLVRVYEDESARFLAAAGRFAEAVAYHDERLARRTERDPLAAAAEATGRVGTIAEIATDTGLADCAAGVSSYDEVLEPVVGPSISRWRVRPTPPTGGRLDDVRTLSTGADVRVYDREGHGTRWYHLEPPAAALDRDGTATLAAAFERLADGIETGGKRAAGRAVRAVAAEDEPVRRIETVLQRHTTGAGLLEDFFADPALSDVYVTAPAEENRVRVRVDGETMTTNVRLTAEGIEALASRFRRESGRAFSRADPTIDLSTEINSRRIRVAGVTEPTSTGSAFVFRAHDREAWTVPALVANGTLTADAAALLSLAVERGRATILAGSRGAGKTTMLGALLWEVPADARTVCIEDAPELPVGPLQESGRDVQALRAGGGDAELTAAAALRTALRLGDGALVVGEVRGEEARVLYEAMRVGANSEAVLGTIHGDGADEVYERVVSDLGVPKSAFGSTDVVVTLEAVETSTGTDRRVATIEEVDGDDPPRFESLYERTGDGLAATGRIDRGNSTLVADLAGPDAVYADVRATLTERSKWLTDLVETGRTTGDALTSAQARRTDVRRRGT